MIHVCIYTVSAPADTHECNFVTFVAAWRENEVRLALVHFADQVLGQQKVHEVVGRWHTKEHL